MKFTIVFVGGSGLMLARSIRRRKTCNAFQYGTLHHAITLTTPTRNATHTITTFKVTATKFNNGTYIAACVGPKGWKDATVTTHLPSKQYPQGTVDIDVKDSKAASAKGYITTYNSAPASPACTQLTWPSGGNYVLEPYAHNNKPAGGGGGGGGGDSVPHAQAFSEGNGNEHRNSYKGYAQGFAQLVHSPTVWSNNAMIINTNKRLTNDKTPGPIGGPQPTHSLAPVSSVLQSCALAVTE